MSLDLAHPAASDARSAAVAAGGLVPSKTTGFEVPGDRESRNARRVARMRRSMWAAGHYHELRRRRVRERVWFVTLTYRAVHGWAPEHVSEYLRALRRWLKAFGVSARYAWVAELQQRGAMHYHVAVWLPAHLALPKPDKSGMWRHGMSQRQLAIAPVGYLMKYASKGDTPFHDFPKGARLYGIGGLCDDGASVRRWLNLPAWAQGLYGVGDTKRIASRVVVLATGEVHQSPYRVELSGGRVLVSCVGPVEPRWFAGPYSAMREAV